MAQWTRIATESLRRIKSPTALMSSNASSVGPIQASIERKIREHLQPIEFSIVNDSQKHAGHAGNPGGGPHAETHFSLTCVSDKFKGQKLIQQHRMIYDLLQEEFDQGLHALALKTKAS